MRRPRGQEDCRLGCHLGSRRRHRTSALNYNNVLVWITGHERQVIVRLVAGQYAHQIIGPDDKEQDEKDDVPVLQIVQGQRPLHNQPLAESGRDHTKRPNSQPKPNQNKNHVHSGQLSLTEGWTLIFDKGGGFLFHTIFGKSPTGTLISRSCGSIFREIDSVCLARSGVPFTKGNTKDE